MDQFKHVFNAPSLYEVLFFNVITTTKYPDLITLEEKEPHMYKHWLSLSEKKFEDSTEKTYLEKGQYMNEFSKIVSIGYGLYHLKNNEVTPFYRYLSGTEENIISKFFTVVNDFSAKKLDGYLCGHNVNGHHIPMLCKGAINHELKIPKTFKNNLVAKPWENSILDTVDLWKFTGGSYVSLELISDYLGLQTERIDFNRLSTRYHNDPEFSLENVTKTRFNQLINLYMRLRNL